MNAICKGCNKKIDDAEKNGFFYCNDCAKPSQSKLLEKLQENEKRIKRLEKIFLQTPGE